MGLLNLFLNNQSNLDVTPIPSQGNGPIAPATGEFNTGVSSFQQPWNSNNTYLNSNFTNAQESTLDLTGLDNTNPLSLPTSPSPFLPPVTPENLPSQAYMGEFGGAPSQYTTIYTPDNTYLNSFNTLTNEETNPQISSLNNTGLDIENTEAAPTTYIAQQIDNITVYPEEATGFENLPASPFSQSWSPTNKYYNKASSLRDENLA